VCDRAVVMSRRTRALREGTSAGSECHGLLIALMFCIDYMGDMPSGPLNTVETWQFCTTVFPNPKTPLHPSRPILVNHELPQPVLYDKKRIKKHIQTRASICSWDRRVHRQSSNITASKRGRGGQKALTEEGNGSDFTRTVCRILFHGACARQEEASAEELWV
jgi:hypothetical protein